MQKPKTPQVDVTRSRETLAELVRRVQKTAQPIELVRRGGVVARVVPAKARAAKKPVAIRTFSSSGRGRGSRS